MRACAMRVPCVRVPCVRVPCVCYARAVRVGYAPFRATCCVRAGEIIHAEASAFDGVYITKDVDEA
jgi:hypothetical protein